MITKGKLINIIIGKKEHFWKFRNSLYFEACFLTVHLRKTKVGYQRGLIVKRQK